MLGMRFQAFSFTGKKEDVNVVVISAVIYKTVSQFFEILIFSQKKVYLGKHLLCP